MTQTLEMQAINRKARIRLAPVVKPYRSPQERIQDFNECSPGYSIWEAQAEAARCLHCPDPAACVSACPMGNDIPSALWHIEQGDFLRAAAIYRGINPLPELCGRVCPDEASCAGACVLTRRGIGINTQALEAFAADYQRTHDSVPLPDRAASTGRWVAVIGAGPAGLTVAEELAKAGHNVTVIEALPAAGGLLVYGIPNFKLEKSLVKWKVDWLCQLGVEFSFNTRIGDGLTVDDLLDREGYDAVFIGTGAEVEATMDIPGEDLTRVYGSLQFLARANVPVEMLPPGKNEPMTVGKRVAVIGGGDTATDCMRTSLRLGAEEVTCYYRRTEAEMPGNAKERHHAEEEGARIEYLTAPVELLDRDGDGQVDAMRMIRMELGEPDVSGRRRPVAVEGSQYEVAVDDVVLAIGFWPDPIIGNTTNGLETHKLIVVNDETGETSRPGVFAAGDNVTGPKLVNEAVASAKKAAAAIHAYLS